MNLTKEQKEKLGITDERVDYYFKVENSVIDGKEVFNEETGEVEKVDLFDNIYQAHLFVVLSRYCNNGKVAYPSISTLCKKCYCSKPTLLKAIKSLEEKGFIAKINRIIEDTKTYETNIYSVKNIDVPVKKLDKKYTENVKEIYQGSKGDLPGVVKEIYQGSKGGLHKEEQIKKNKLKKTIIINKTNYIDRAIFAPGDNNNFIFVETKKLKKYLFDNIQDVQTCKNIMFLVENRGLTLERIQTVVEYSKKNTKGNGYIYSALENNWDIPTKKAVIPSLVPTKKKQTLGEQELKDSLPPEEKEYKELEFKTHNIIKKQPDLVKEFYKIRNLEQLKQFIDKNNIKVS